MKKNMSICFLLLFPVLYYLQWNYTISTLNSWMSIKIDSFDKYFYNFDSIYQKNGRLLIEGWIVKKNEDIQKSKISICLYDHYTNKVYILKTSIKIREDVTSYLNDGFNYNYCGFASKVNCNLLKKQEYYIWILYQNNGRREIINTEQKIFI